MSRKRYHAVATAMALVKEGVSINEAARQCGVDRRVVQVAVMRQRARREWQIIIRTPAGSTRTVSVAAATPGGAIIMAGAMPGEEIILVKRQGSLVQAPNAATSSVS